MFITFMLDFANCVHYITEAAERDWCPTKLPSSSRIHILWAVLSLPTQCFAAAHQGSRTNVVMSWPTPAITSVRMRGCAH